MRRHENMEMDMHMRNAFRLAAAALVAVSATAQSDEVDRVITVTAVEYEMRRLQERTPFPDTLETHPDLEAGGGYRLTPPDDTGEWRARSYQWAPGVIVVNEGERVALEFFGINGDRHGTRIEGYDLEFVVRRGELTRVVFTADKPGLFSVICAEHQPSMTAQLLVQPASGGDT